ncbi:MAG TPA: SCP2 sterol-binding domain-containing protein [Acidimicrobiales bacterium]|nr:SCP2 sterol-binding domain-containing protein [Acidimicrobiales bacterium]
MARFLSAEWFDEIEAATGHAGPGAVPADRGASTGGGAGSVVGTDGGRGPSTRAGNGGRARRAAQGEGLAQRDEPGAGGPPVVVEILVAGAPQGEVRYQVVVDGERVRVLPPGSAFKTAQVVMNSDYETFSGIASGRLSPIDALSKGMARISGDTRALYPGHGALLGADLLPPEVRARTTF